jgi:hypothetical protein
MNRFGRFPIRARGSESIANDGRVAAVALARPAGAPAVISDGSQPTPINQHRQRSIEPGLIAIETGPGMLSNLVPSHHRLGPLSQPPQDIDRIV